MTPLSRLLTLRADLRDPDAAAEVAPEALAAYAERTGWRLVATTAEHQTYQRGTGELHVPLTAGWPGYGRRMLGELRELAEVEGRSPLAVWAELVGLVSAPHEGAQGVLPGMTAPVRERRRSIHRWGVIAREELPPEPLNSGQPHEGQIERCPHCRTLRRRANTGRRLGAELMYSRDGQEWGYAVPPCRVKT